MNTTQATNATTTEPAMVIDGRLYVVTDSALTGRSVVKSLVGPNGGGYVLWVHPGGAMELCGGKQMRTIWKGPA
jgi:hypothetical protein